MAHTWKIAALAASGLFASTTTANAETITVCASGCDHTSINAAIDGSQNGDVIQLAAETYYEGSVINTDGKAITIRGVLSKDGDPESTLDGSNTHCVLICEGGETESTVFENLLIVNGSAAGCLGNVGGGIYIGAYVSPTLTNCTFYSNLAHRGGGMFNDGAPALTNCTFLSNGAIEGGGMYNGENSSPVLTGCTFTDNLASDTFPDSHDGRGGAIFSNEFGTVTVVDCVFSGNEPDCILGNFNTVSAPGTPGDMDGDDDADVTDFALLRNQIGVANLGCVGSDINGDGEVNGADMAFILSWWGVCSP